MNIRERVRDSMYALGMPIVQGACSTIIGVIGLAMAPSYIFITFFKMVFLVIVLGALHGLILLPVLLSLFGPGACDRSGSKKAALGQAASCDNQNVDVVVAPQLAVVVPVSNGKLAAQQNHYPHSNGKKHYQVFISFCNISLLDLSMLTSRPRDSRMAGLRAVESIPTDNTYTK